MLEGHLTPHGRTWPSGWPVAKGVDVHQERIRLKHYQYRSPSQIEGRLVTRRRAISSGGAFHHEGRTGWLERVVSREAQLSLGEQEDESGEPSWHDRIVPAELLDKDLLDGRLVARPDLVGPLPRRRRP